MSNGILYNVDGEHIKDWFDWPIFLLMFGTPAIMGLVEGGIPLFLLIGLPAFMMILIQKYMPI